MGYAGMHGKSSSSEIRRCTFSGNSVSEYNGGAIWCGVSSSLGLTGCVFADNRANEEGGAITCAESSSMSISQCTSCGNSSGLAGSLYLGTGSSLILTQTIVAIGESGQAVYCADGSNATLRCCDVYGNIGGDWAGCIEGQNGVDGNFSADPWFCNANGGDFSLAADSPCLPGNHPDGYDCDLIDAFGQGCEALGVEDPSNPFDAIRLLISPNPFRDATRLCYAPPVVRAVAVSIFDVAGRLVRAWDPVKEPGVIMWDGTTSVGRPVGTGTYFVGLKTAGMMGAKRVVVLR